MSEHNTRLRTNSQILPPRRLRQDESVLQSPTNRRAKPPSQAPFLAQFPPPNIQFHPEDAVNKTFLAIGRALFAVENRAVTIKDLSYLTMKHGLVCQNASAASQAITTFIRNHLNRCRQDHSTPLLLSLPLTGTDADDRLAPALHSRSGGTSVSAKSSDSALTNFRRGTTVWYLSEAAGAVCPFQRAGLSLDDIISSASQNGTKRKRDSQSSSNQPRKHHANSLPPSSSPTRSPDHSEFLPKIKFTLKLRTPVVPTHHSLSPSDSELELSASEDDEGDFEDNDGSESESESSISATTAPLPLEDDSDDSYDSTDDSTEFEPSIHDIHDEPQVGFLLNSKLYPGSSTIPTSQSTVQRNDSHPFYFTPKLCSTQFIKSTLTSFRTALAHPSNNSRTESPSQSVESPPPDSEDEDDDFHNSMVGLRRDSMPVPEPKIEDERNMPKLEPISPKFVPGSVHLARKSPEVKTSFDLKPESPLFHSTSPPLETIPGFVLEPELSVPQVAIKEEEPTIALSWIADPCYGSHEIKFDTSVQTFPRGLGPCSDHVQIDDVEILGPETVPSREWDMAWSQFDEQTLDDAMNVDMPRPQNELHERQTDHTASASLSPSSSPISITTTFPSDIHPSTIVNSTAPSIFAAIIDDVPLYCTMLGPDAPLVRRIDNDAINILQLYQFLQIPLDYFSASISSSRLNALQGIWVSLDVAKLIVEQLRDRLPVDILTIFLASDLEKYFPDLGKMRIRESAVNSIILMSETSCEEKPSGDIMLVQDESSAEFPQKDVGIRVEDLFVPMDFTDHANIHEKEIKQKSWTSTSVSMQTSRPASVSLYSDGMRPGSTVLGYAEQNGLSSLNEQEEKLFHSLVDVDNDTASRNQQLLVRVEKRTLNSSSFLLSSTLSSGTKLTDDAIMANEKENSGAPVNNTKKRRDKAPVQPVRRSTRVASKALPSTLTRSLRKAK